MKDQIDETGGRLASSNVDDRMRSDSGADERQRSHLPVEQDKVSSICF